MIRTFALLLAALAAFGQEIYRQPPKEILDILNAPATPTLSVNPSKTHAALMQQSQYPPIEEVSQPMLRLAGLRINPRTNALHLPRVSRAVTLVRLSDGAETAVSLPSNAKAGMLHWSPDGKQFAFMNTAPASSELWIGDLTGKTRRIESVKLNAVTREPIAWLPDGKTLAVLSVPAGRGAPPAEATVPKGPNVQESAGRAGPVPTYQDLLKDAHDGDLFEYYATSQPVLVDVVSGRGTPLGKPAIYSNFAASPDGKYFLVTRVRRPFSYQHTYRDFPRDIEIIDRTAAVARKVASLPLNDRVPIEGVETGARNPMWKPNEPATMVWVEALDGGNPNERATHRDKIVALRAPFKEEPADLLKIEHRYRSIQFGEKGDWALVTDFERERRWLRVQLVDFAKGGESKTLWSRNQGDRYRDPGNPVLRRDTGSAAGGGGGAFGFGAQAGIPIAQDGDSFYLRGQGASPEGDRPFIDRFNLATQKAERVFRSAETHYETVEAILDGSRMIVKRESPAEPPNYFLKSEGGLKALTKFTDPAPRLRQITKQRVTYQRADGVPLSFTLHLPPGYKQGTKLPTVVWAYPREYDDRDTAGQVSGSVQRFTTITGASHLFYPLLGYALLDEAAMPVVGDARTVNNTYVEQIVANAQAAIDKAVEMGVTDRKRVGVGGHSYGAFMTANLLAHCDLFRAGIARSGAHNRTLTPFGFQNERRTLWEAPDVYLKMSPFLVANKIKEPLLLIHGEADNNTGTFPVQSERMYAAVRGNGGTVRLVFLPHESHGYAGRESIEHTLWEMFSWMEKHVKNGD